MNGDDSIQVLLRRTRESKGASLQAANEATHLSLNVLRGLELGSFDVVEPVYMRLALQTYAGYLDLNTDALLEFFDSQVARSRASPDQLYEDRACDNYFLDIRNILSHWRCRLQIGAIAILIAILTVFLAGDASVTRVRSFRDVPQETTPPPSSPIAIAADRPFSRSLDSAFPQAIQAISDTTRPTETSAGLRRMWTVHETSDKQRSKSSGAGGNLVLGVEAVDTTWVEVKDAARILFSGILNPGEQRSLSSGDLFLVRSGRPNGIRYTFQGKLLGVDGRLGSFGEYLRFRASQTGVALLDVDMQPLQRQLGTAHP